MQISSNGLITFKLPLINYRNKPFSETFTLFSDAIIAPMWTDFVLTGRARLHYRVSRYPSDLDILSRLIANATSDDSYRPILAVIVTWENIALFEDKSRTVSALYI